VVERRGYEDLAHGIKRVVTLIRKGTKKEKKKNNFTCIPVNEAMVVVGLVRLEGQSTVVGIMCGEAGV